jgi:metal-responsive CopG/Arc/MetJ family transcriptional regulator
MEANEKNESAGQEIEALKKRIAELELFSGDKERSEIIREAIKERIEKTPESVLAENQRFAPAEAKERAERIAALKFSSRETEVEAHQRQILELLQIAQNKGILNAIAIIRHLDDPHLEDDFHDALVKYFQSAYNV